MKTAGSIYHSHPVFVFRKW